MRRAAPVALCLACLAAVVGIAAPASAQGEVKLELKAADTDTSGVMRMARQYVHASAMPASQLSGLPEGATGNWLHVRTTLGARQLFMAMAQADTGKLYVDTDGDGSLTDEKPLQASTKSGKRVFGPVTLSAGEDGDGGERRTVSLSVMQPTRGNYLICSPGGYWAGTARLGGRDVAFGLVDSDWDGRIARGEFSMQAVMSRRFDSLAIDLDGDGRFSTSMRNFEVMPLPRLVRVGGVYYSLGVKPDASGITFTKVEPELGTLDAGAPDAELMLFGDTGSHHLEGAGGTWQLPAGDYLAGRVVLSRKDRSGATWSLSGRPGQDSGPIRVEAGKTASLGLGGPLVAAADVATRGSRNAVSIGFALKSAGGIQFAPGATKDGKRQAAPAFKILDDKGAVLKADKFSYG